VLDEGSFSYYYPLSETFMHTEHSFDYFYITGFPHRRLHEVPGRDLNPGPALQQASELPLEPCIFCQPNTIRRHVFAF